MLTESIQYYDDTIQLEGYLAYEKEATQQRRPAVIVAHDWTGRNEFACKKAESLAQLGYVGFALDMYGAAKQGGNNDEKMQLIEPLMQDRNALKNRVLAAYDYVRSHDAVDPTKIAAIGFCFGGLCVLDLARSGTELAGVVSFHGLLNAPEGLASQPIKAHVLALHGHDDPMVPPEQVAAFQQEMTAAKANWQIHIYGNVMHAFTNPLANDPDFGTVYSTCADHRSWLAMQNFLAEVFS